MQVLYFHTGRSSFVDKDVKILQGIATVRTFAFSADRKWKTPLVFFRQFAFLFRHVFSSKIMISQFAGYHSFLPGLFGRILGKKSLIIVGGTDCVSYPSIGYGNFCKPLLGRFTRWSYMLCDHIAPKHDTLRICDYQYDEDSPKKQGVLAFMPKLKKPFSSIPNGYDPEFWKCTVATRKKNSFITVSTGMDFPFQTRLKGIDMILEAAVEFPDCTFTIVGVPPHVQLPVRSSNVRTLPPSDASALRSLYCEHSFYIQISMAEGFPNALSEAMSCGCVPIGSAVFSIPEIIGVNGVLLYRRNLDNFKTTLRHAKSIDTEAVGKAAAASIRQRFPLERRRKELLALVKGLAQDQ